MELGRGGRPAGTLRKAFQSSKAVAGKATCRCMPDTQPGAACLSVAGPPEAGRLRAAGGRQPTWSGRLSLSGSVPLIWSERPGPRTTTPQRCSVAYLTLTACCGPETRRHGSGET